MTATLLTLMLLSSAPDAPLRESEPRLTPAAWLQRADTRVTQSKIARGLAIAGFTTAGVTTVVFLAGMVDNALKELCAGLGNLVFGAFSAGAAFSGGGSSGGGSSFRAQPTDYTPLLGAAAGAVVVGLVSTFAGVLLSSDADSARAEAQTEEQRRTDERIREIEARANALLPLTLPELPPAPRADPNAVRHPLVPRQP